MSAEQIRCDTDKTLLEQLLKHEDVRRVNSLIERLEEENSKKSGVRRQLLATSVRLSQRISPKLHKMAKHCQEKLGIKTPLELFSYSSSTANAACFKPEDGKLFIMFSSKLIESFNEGELLFVMGHELGHHVYAHHDVPIGQIVKGDEKPNRSLVMKLFTWSRYAEISADRAGAFCSGSLEDVAKSLFKLASGVTNDNIIEFHHEDFLAQVDEMVALDSEPGQGAPTGDWFLTHPFSPLRVKALCRFFDSSLMKKGGISKEELEGDVRVVMNLMEQNYLKADTDVGKSMKSLFIAGAALIVAADKEYKKEEHEMFDEFLDDKIDFEKLDIEGLSRELPDRIRLVLKHASPAEQMQIVRDLCLVALADGDADKKEVAIINKIAKQLNITEEFVVRTLNEELVLD